MFAVEGSFFNFRLEVGTAHRCNVDETNHGDNQTLITYRHDFILRSTGGRRPPLNERKAPVLRKQL